MKVYLVTFTVFVVVWITAWFAVIRPLLRRYDIIADVRDRIAAAEGFPKKILVWLEAKKTLVVAFVMSLLAAGKGAVDTTVSTVTGLHPTDLAPLQDKTLWGAFFSDIVSLHILAALSLLAALLSLKGKVTAAQIVPKG